MKISRRDFEDLHPKFAVKSSGIFKPLILNKLQKPAIIVDFVKIFQNFQWVASHGRLVFF